MRILLRLEGVVLFAGMTLLYGLWEGSWWVYAILFLAPDLSFAAYLAGPKMGAAIYNAAHSYFGPVALMTIGLAMAAPLTLSLAMIWLEYADDSGVGQWHDTWQVASNRLNRTASDLVD